MKDNNTVTTPAAKQVTATPKTTTTQGSRASTPNRVSANSTPYVYEKSKNVKVGGSSNSRKEDSEPPHNSVPSFREEVPKDEIKTVSTKINFNELTEREVSPNFPKSSTFRNMDTGFETTGGEDTKENSFISSITSHNNISTISTHKDKSPGPKESNILRQNKL